MRPSVAPTLDVWRGLGSEILELDFDDELPEVYFQLERVQRLLGIHLDELAAGRAGGVRANGTGGELAALVERSTAAIGEVLERLAPGGSWPGRPGAVSP